LVPPEADWVAGVVDDPLKNFEATKMTTPTTTRPMITGATNLKGDEATGGLVAAEATAGGGVYPGGVGGVSMGGGGKGSPDEGMEETKSEGGVGNGN